MKRKVIQIAGSTQLISLPRAWAKKFQVKKGDELDIEEQNNKLLISTDRGISLERKEVNITELDTSSILHRIQGAYKLGYDEIVVMFDKPTALDFDSQKRVKTGEVVKKIVNRLIGVEIISQKENCIVIRDISATSFKEFDNVLRRVFLLMIDMSNDILSCVKDKDSELLNSVQEKHDMITKFISFCLRLLNKKGYEDYKKTPSLYHITATLDKLTDIYKYLARELMANDCVVGKEALSIIEETNNSLRDYYNIFYKFEQFKIVEMSKRRRELLLRMSKLSGKSSGFDAHLCGRMTSILDILLDLTEARMAIED